MPDPTEADYVMKSVAGGYLVQTRDNVILDQEQLKVVTKRAPSDAEMRDLIFAFTVGKHVKSNTIVYAKAGATVGIGAGQMSRIDSAHIAARKAEDVAKAEKTRGSAHEGLGGGLGCFLPPSPTACYRLPKQAPPPSSNPAVPCAMQK